MRPSMMTKSGQHHWCLVKEMKTWNMSANYAAGMWAEPPQSVEQLMVMPAGLCVWSGCLSGLSVPLRPDWPGCLLVGLWWAAESLLRSHWGSWAASLQRGTPYLYHPLKCIHWSMYTVPYEVTLSSLQEWYKSLTYYLLCDIIPCENSIYG